MQSQKWKGYLYSSSLRIYSLRFVYHFIFHFFIILAWKTFSHSKVFRINAGDGYNSLFGVEWCVFWLRWGRPGERQSRKFPMGKGMPYQPLGRKSLDAALIFGKSKREKHCGIDT